MESYKKEFIDFLTMFFHVDVTLNPLYLLDVLQDFENSKK